MGMQVKALVTGSKGFIGRHFTHYLRAQDWLVLECDIRDPEPLDCRRFFHQSRIHFDLVVHAAAVIPDLEQRGLNAMPVAGNLEIDAAFFQWAMKTMPTKAVYFSSAAAYPIDLNRPERGMKEDDIDLDDLRQPDGMYGMVKLVGEVQAREARHHGLDVLVVRPQTGYGEDQSLSYPFPKFIAQAKQRADPFVVWGSGKQIRDLIHVDDIVAATMALLDAGENGPVNLGIGLPIDMAYLAKKVSHGVPNYVPSFAFQYDKPEGSPARYADIEKMLEFYSPKISVWDGIKRALA